MDVPICDVRCELTTPLELVVAQLVAEYLFYRIRLFFLTLP